ncbi:threonine/serine exporter ThrE family protein [Streptomyces sp. NPDC021093]|uniref:threonine/serine exporter ThrE family protein n=1 Tax=Streptomyces sp. NPDC021093 TaxID=3365112 RepID=UPI0037AFA493
MPSKSLPWLQRSLGRLRGLESAPDPFMAPPADPEHPDAAFVIALALLIGDSLMANGAAAEETVAGMLVTAETYGLQWCEPDVTLWVVSLTGRMADDTEPTSEHRVIRRTTLDFTALESTHRLIQEISDGRLTAVEARARVIGLCPAPATEAVQSRAALWGKESAHAGLVAASGSLIAGGDLPVVIPSFVAATLAGRVSTALAAYGVPAFYRIALAVLPAAVFAVVADNLGHGHYGPAIIVGGVLALLPALTIISAVQDALTGHYVTAYARLMESLLVFLAIVSGTGAVMALAAKAGYSLPILPQTKSLDYFSWRLLGAAMFTVALASRMHVPRRKWIITALLGVGGVIGYLALRNAGFLRLSSTGIMAVSIGAVGQYLAQRARVSALPLVIPAVTPLLPGSMLYRALSELAVNHVQQGIAQMVQAMAMLIILATGVSVSGEAAYFLRQLRGQHRTSGDVPP